MGVSWTSRNARSSNLTACRQPKKKRLAALDIYKLKNRNRIFNNVGVPFSARRSDLFHGKGSETVGNALGGAGMRLGSGCGGHGRQPLWRRQ